MPDYNRNDEGLKLFLQGMQQMQDFATQNRNIKGNRDLSAQKAQETADETTRNQGMVETMAKSYPGRSVSASGSGGVSIGGKDAALRGLLQLTPAQETAEKAVGKQIADFESAGGRPAMQKNLQSLHEVQGELGPEGNRGRYDRAVGTVFGGFPSILGALDSTEKARRDKARNTALSIAKQTDPNPTEKQIETIMGQIYDPASSNEDNHSRITRFLGEQENKMSQMEQAAHNYHRSGYATLGGAAPLSPQPNLGSNQQPSNTSVRKQYSPSRNQTRLIYPDGRVEIKDGKQ